MFFQDSRARRIPRLQPAASAGFLAAGWIITTFLWGLPDPYWVVGELAFVFVLPVQTLANRINAKIAPDHDPNRRFSAWNIVVVAVFIILAIIGASLPD